MGYSVHLLLSTSCSLKQELFSKSDSTVRAIAVRAGFFPGLSNEKYRIGEEKKSHIYDPSKAQQLYNTMSRVTKN